MQQFAGLTLNHRSLLPRVRIRNSLFQSTTDNKSFAPDFIHLFLVSSSMSRIIFGSCSSQHYPEQPLWPVIQNRNATAFVWGGDAVYGDDRTVWEGWFRRRLLSASPDYLRELFDEQRRERGYEALLRTNISIFGTIDDHDYGINNGDRTFEWRHGNTMEFVRFLGLSEDSPMFLRASRGQGVYGVQVYDFDRPMSSRLLSDAKAGLDPDVLPDNPNVLDSTLSSRKKRVAVFVLDIRTNKTPWRKGFPERYQIDSEGDFLGEEQWKWFETAISRSTAAVNVVVTGLQVHPDRTYDPSVVENWSGFPRSQQRMQQALLQPNVQAPIIISGDVHMMQMMRKDCKKTTNGGEKIRPLHEITTSGMTHSWGTQVCGRANDNPICHSAYHNFIFRRVMHFAHWFCPWTEMMMDEKSNEILYRLDRNVAELEFDWDHDRVLVNILGENEDDNPMLQREWSFRDLTERKDTQVDSNDFEKIRRRLLQHNIISKDSAAEESDWICVHYRGLPNHIHFAFGAVLPLALVIFLGMIIPFFLLVLVCLRCFKLRRRLRPSANNSPSRPKIE